ncbi:MAG: NUDIX domain-containing protein [Trueperaceae bacterium]|nr:NUDIX domain-containing protein [Trueperaceae bacterium]
MRTELLRWYHRSARPLPWRREPRDPYLTWVVETMSQQTRIDTVVARLPAFLARFPDVQSLAAADQGEVLAAWAGLGYYRRARALHAAARVVTHDLGGRWPPDVAGWLRLPGVGPYTAAAVAAQALGSATIAVDGNVRRVGARLLGLREPTDAELRRGLADLLLGTGPTAQAVPVDDDPARVAEALVELGAVVCTPRRPACDGCPLRPGCAAAAAGDPTAFPAPRRRARVQPLTLHAWWVVRAGEDGHVRLGLERRPQEGLWGGLHGPPWRSEAPADGERVASFHHLLTHRRVEAVVWRAPTPPADAEVGWYRRDEALALGLAAIDRRALSILDGVGALG